MPDEMQDPRIADARNRMMAMRGRNDMMRGQQEQAAGQFQGGLALPEQLPPPPAAMGPMGDWAGPKDESMFTQIQPMNVQRPEMNNEQQMAMAQRFKQNAGFNPASMNNAAPRQLPPQAMGQGQPGMPQRPMGVPPPQGTPAQMPMANTMNPNANSARPNMMRNRMMQRRGGMGMQQRQAGQTPEVGGASPVPPRSITPF